MTSSKKIAVIALMIIVYGLYGMNSMNDEVTIKIYEKNGDVIATMNIPDIDADNIHVRIERGRLHVWASQEHKEEMSGKNYYAKEIESGSFDRIISLPSGIDTDAMDWEVADGVLTVTIPKIEE